MSVIASSKKQRHLLTRFSLPLNSTYLTSCYSFLVNLSDLKGIAYGKEELVTWALQFLADNLLKVGAKPNIGIHVESPRVSFLCLTMIFALLITLLFVLISGVETTPRIPWNQVGNKQQKRGRNTYSRVKSLVEWVPRWRNAGESNLREERLWTWMKTQSVTLTKKEALWVNSLVSWRATGGVRCGAGGPRQPRHHYANHAPAAPCMKTLLTEIYYGQAKLPRLQDTRVDITSPNMECNAAGNLIWINL